MPADSPPSLLITPDLRRRLQQRFEEAQRLTAHPRTDYRRIHDLLAECLRADPGNILYLDALLANLRKREAMRRFPAWLTNWPSWQPRKSDRDTTGTPSSVLASGPDALWRNHQDPRLLMKLAAAAGECDFDETEVLYLTAAREMAPDDPEMLRLLARAWTRQGRFEDAEGPWFAVLALLPEDAEAATAVEDLCGASERAHRATRPDMLAASGSPEILIGLAEQMQGRGQLSRGRSVFGQCSICRGRGLGFAARSRGFAAAS